ncbi:hypothetical protein [Aurantimonas sp. Leaf443]|uniref:hypothetical protein n=1 Tax=Aurantimonas sp. Leaf443 TaxID=1736378 RepID=UPI000A5A8202|nr:hypothetical protein [Aurantimonas sp. Leaf443]
MNTPLHPVADANGRSLRVFLTAGPVGDRTGAAVFPDGHPKAQWLLGHRGRDAEGVRDTLPAKTIEPCIRGRKSRTAPVRQGRGQDGRGKRIAIPFGRLEDRRPVATGQDRCPTVFFSAIDG